MTNGVYGHHKSRGQITRELAERAGFSLSEAKKIMDALFDPRSGILAEKMRAGRSVSIPGFGTFEGRHRKARTGRNPRTGREIKIGPGTSPAFRAGKALKDSVKKK